MAKGCPSEYTPEINVQVYEYARVGLTDKQIAQILKIAERTFNNWKREYPDFFQSVRRGKEEFDSEQVEASLLKRALGYDHPAEKIFLMHSSKANPVIKRAKQRGRRCQKGAPQNTQTPKKSRPTSSPG